MTAKPESVESVVAEMFAEAGQENCDGEPWDSIQRWAQAILTAHRAEMAEALKENFALAAGQCDGVVGSDGGTPTCKYKDGLLRVIAFARHLPNCRKTPFAGVTTKDCTCGYDDLLRTL